ncbi:hypothetical protein [Hymenobacter baengnokdamensis]|uniref:hypothetical protein n=1 Tax=Hymenobacter baengnokdamensis TaxID=2615203 RepID=UPI0012462188|nr:hypothetical protein [Hymenobacter baengnokdamensis]
MKTEQEIRSALSMLYSRRDVYAAESVRGELADQSLLDDIWGKIYALRWALGQNIQCGVDFQPQEEGEGAFKDYPLSSYCYPGCQVPTEPVALPVGQEHYPPLVSTHNVQAALTFSLEKATAFSAYARQKYGIMVLSEREDWAFDDTEQDGPPIVRFVVAADRADSLFWLGLHFERAQLIAGSLTDEEQQALLAARMNPNSLQAIAELRKLATPGFWEPGAQGITASSTYHEDGEDKETPAVQVLFTPQNQHYICRMHNVLPRLEAGLKNLATLSVREQQAVDNFNAALSAEDGGRAWSDCGEVDAEVLLSLVARLTTPNVEGTK